MRAIFLKVFVGFLFCFNISFGQFKNSIWCFGDSTGIDFSNITNPLTFNATRISRGSSCSIADSNDNLLFYAGTFYLPLYQSGYSHLTAVYNIQGTVMQGGDSIVGRGWYKELIILPVPDSNKYFYLFSSGVTSIYGLYYSVVDLNLNSGLGALVQKNIQLLPHEGTDGLAAIKHGNGRDWWLFFRRWDITNNYFYVYLITPFGANLNSVQMIGSIVNYSNVCRIEPSFDGTKFAFITAPGLIEVFDFDRCSGIISNPINIDTEQPIGNPIPWYWSCELSPDKSKLYVMSILQGSIQDTSYLLQFDMNAPNIYASRDTIHIFNTPTQPGAIELAPDGKMYIASTYEWGGFPFPYPDSVHNVYNENLSVINFPDSLDASCNFQPFSFYLGGNRTYYGLPNNPNYELGAWIGSSCDTLGVGVEELTIKSEAELFVTFISEWDKLFINAKRLKGKDCLLWVFDVNGKIIFSSEKKSEPPYFTMDVNCASFAKGMYIVRLQTEKEILTKKFIIN